MNRALVIQTAFLGDVILALPVVQVLKKTFPESQIDFLAIPETADIVTSHPDISKAVIYDKHNKHHALADFLELRGGLKKRMYDLVVCPHRSLRSALLASGTGATIRIGFDRSASKRSFTHFVPWELGVHEIDRNLSLLSPLGIDAERVAPRLYPREEDVRAADRFLSMHEIDPPYVAIAPGTAWNTKQYPLRQMEEVVRGFHDRFNEVVLIGGKRDAEIVDGLLDVGAGVVSGVGELSFMASAEIIRRASLLIANDSAPVHVASAFNVPTVAIFGPTVRDFGFYPYHERSRVVEIEGLGCRPCSIHGGSYCPIGTFECMKKISPDRIIETGLEMLSLKTNSQNMHLYSESSRLEKKND